MTDSSIRFNRMQRVILKEKRSRRMQEKWYHIFPKSPFLSVYVWIIFSVLPFFFIFRSSTLYEVILGLSAIVLFFLSYYFSRKARPGLVYMWISFEIILHVMMTLIFGYPYLSLFIAFFIGTIRQPVGFYILYGIHIAVTIIAVGVGLFIDLDLFLPQMPFIIVAIIGTILLPFNLYYRNKRANLEGQLEDAKEQISALHVVAERERIARDLHDTLGQKLSMIGLKSELAARFIDRDLEAAKKELRDIRQTSRIALKEVRELVAGMRAIPLNEELPRVQQMLEVATIQCHIEGDAVIKKLPAITENVVSMCLKEAVTNVVKHSEATTCTIRFEQQPTALVVHIEDDGIGLPEHYEWNGSGFKGMRERIEFLNGTLHVTSHHGTTITLRVPNVITHQKEEKQ